MAFQNIKSVLTDSDSVVTGVATMAVVFGIYNNKVGTLSSIHMTPANDANIAASIKKAGIISAVMVAGLFAITRDANIVILGASAIIAEELTYRHANMASDATGQIEITPTDYYQAPSSASVSQQTSYLDY